LVEEPFRFYSGVSANSKAAYTRKWGSQSYRSHGTSGGNRFSLNGLEGIFEVELEPENAFQGGRFPVISGQLRLICGDNQKQTLGRRLKWNQCR
jgi:hypothetical protein